MSKRWKFTLEFKAQVVLESDIGRRSVVFT